MNITVYFVGGPVRSVLRLGWTGVGDDVRLLISARPFLAALAEALDRPA